MKLQTHRLVFASVMALGLFALALPGAYGSLSNSLAVICGVVPTAALMGLARKCRSSGFGQFLCGVGLIALGMAFFALSGHLQLGLDAFFEAFNRGAGTSYTKSSIGFGDVSLWVFLVPAVSTGVGVNLISSHLSSPHEA